jgi:hypothetical protein
VIFRGIETFGVSCVPTAGVLYQNALPAQQIGEGERRPTMVLVEPDTKVVQRYLGRQPGEKAV